MGHIKSINLDESSVKLWNERFSGKRDFSAWIQEKLKEDFDNFSEQFWINQMNEQRLIIEKATANIAHADRQLSKLKEIKQVKVEREEIVSINKQIESLAIRIGNKLPKFDIKIDVYDYMQLSEDLAREYYSLEIDPKPSIEEFLLGKGYKLKQKKEKK